MMEKKNKKGSRNQKKKGRERGKIPGLLNEQIEGSMYFGGESLKLAFACPLEKRQIITGAERYGRQGGKI